jgi:hypothetical protein
MRVMKLALACLIVSAFVAGAALAQEGFPLKGTWLGDWGPNKTTRTQIFIVMDWDGKAISGTINPGTDNIPLKNASLTPPTPAPPRGGGGVGQGGGGGGGGRRGGGGGQGAGQGAATPAPAPPPPPPAPAAAAVPPGPVQPDWLVHFEADGKDKSGAAVHYVIDGKVENIGLANRTIVGTWTAGAAKNDFKLIRQ